MKKVLLSLVMFALLSLGLAQPFVWPNTWIADPEGVQTGGIFRSYEVSEVRTFNPFVTAESTGVSNLTFQGASLLTRGPDSDEWLPYAAQSFSVAADGLSIDIVLRDGLVWSDGTAITVQDYFFTYQAETDEEVGSNSYDSWFIGEDQITLEITGDNSLRVTFPKSDRTAFSVAAITPWPDHILGEIYRSGGAEALRAAWGTESDLNQFVGSGPFIPREYRAGERVVFVKNPTFGQWNVDEAGRPLPYMDGYNFAVVESADSALNLYLAGELDAFNPRTLDDIGVINVAVQNGDIDAIVLENASPVASSQFIAFNWNKESQPFLQSVFRNSDFRRAMSHLADREAMIDLIYGGAATPAYSSVYAVLDYWVNPDAPRYDYDPEAAAVLLRSIGFTRTNSDGTLIDAEGNALSFTLATNAGNSQREQIAQIFADSAREVGVDVQVQAIEFSVLVDQLLSTGDDRPFDAILIGLTGGDRDYPFGSNVIPCGTNLHMYNTSGGCLTVEEQLMTRLYYQGRETLDTAAARDIGFQIQATEAKLQPIVYTVSPAAHYSWLSSIGGAHPADTINAIVGSRQIALTYKK